MSDRPRFLITRLSAVGDCVLTMPVACALRKAYPDAYIAWIVQGGGYQLLRDHACLDSVVKVPRGWLKSPTAVWNLHKSLHNDRLDWCIDVQSLTKSAMAGWLSGAEKRVTFTAPQGRELAPWLSTCSVERTATHVVDAYLQLLEPLGVKDPEVEFQVPIDEQAELAVRRFQNEKHLDEYYIINPGAGWGSKVWPAKNYGQVARQLGQQTGVRSIVMWAGEEERAWAEQIVAVAGKHAILAPRTTLSELASFVRNATFFLGSDTGPLHLAAAVGTPCVGLYGPTMPEDCGPYGEQHMTLQAYYQSGSCRERRRAENLAMRAIGIYEVTEACGRMLDQRMHCRAA